MATKTNNPISDLVKTKEIFNTAISYLKSKPENLIYISYIFALGKVESKILESRNALIFHRDVDHFKFLKFFYYLTDCPIGGGHHEYFTKTHRNIKFNVAPVKRYEKNEISLAYPEAELLKISGSRGYGFAEDTSGFHRGTPLENGFRVMLMIEVHPKNILRGGEIEFPTSVI